MRPTITVALLLLIGGVAFAGEGLKTDYSESISSSSLNSTSNRTWTTSRDGRIILIRVENDLTRDETWAQVDQSIMLNGKPVMHFVSLKGKRSTIYHPDSQAQVIQTDPDAEGLPSRITLLDSKQQIVDIFQADQTGRISPANDEELMKWRGLFKQMESLENF